MKVVCLSVQVTRLPSRGRGRFGQVWVHSVFNITDAWFYKDIIAIYILLAVVVMIYVTELKNTMLLAMFCIQWPNKIFTNQTRQTAAVVCCLGPGCLSGFVAASN